MPGSSRRDERLPAWLIVPASRERLDGIRDYAFRLGSAIEAERPAVFLTTRDDAAPPADGRLLDSWRDVVNVSPRPGCIIVNYQPQAWMRRDALALFTTLGGLRGAGVRVLVVFHEYQLDPAPAVRRRAARVLFRGIARAVARRADALVATHGFVAARLREDGLDRAAPVHIIPVGSNVDAIAERRPLAGSSVMFGQPAGMNGPVVREAVAQLRAAGHPPLRWICRNSEEAARWLANEGLRPDDITIRAALDTRAVAAELASASVAFAPIVDGVSTRRTTVVAFLQHGLPIAGTTGRATDPLFGDSGAFLLSPVDDPAAGARSLVAVLGDRARQDAMSREARTLFEQHLTWPRIARHFLELAS